jgi:antirestriction protein ArdC
MKGERETMVVYADRFIPDDERRRAAEAGEEPGVIPLIERFTVFNTINATACPRRSLSRSWRLHQIKSSLKPRR